MRVKRLHATKGKVSADTLHEFCCHVLSGPFDAAYRVRDTTPKILLSNARTKSAFPHTSHFRPLHFTTGFSSQVHFFWSAPPHGHFEIPARFAVLHGKAPCRTMCRNADVFNILDFNNIRHDARCSMPIPSNAETSLFCVEIASVFHRLRLTTDHIPDRFAADDLFRVFRRGSIFLPAATPIRTAPDHLKTAISDTPSSVPATLHRTRSRCPSQDSCSHLSNVLSVDLHHTANFSSMSSR